MLDLLLFIAFHIAERLWHESILGVQLFLGGLGQSRTLGDRVDDV